MKNNDSDDISSQPASLSRRAAIKTSLLAATALAISPAYASPPPKHSISMKISVHPGLINDESIITFTSSLKRICNINFEINSSIGTSPITEMLNGSSEMAFTNICYESQLPEALYLFSGIPFGMNLIETVSWFKQDQGQNLFDELFDEMGLKAWIIKFKGASAGAWHNKELTGPGDYKNKKIITHGLSKKVLKKMGANVVEMPIYEAKKAFETKKIDAIEGICPSESLDLGFERLDANYYWPGWHTPCESFFIVMKKNIFEALPIHVKSGIEWLSYANISQSISSYTYNNCLKTPILTSIPKLSIKRLPDSLLIETARATLDTLNSISNASLQSKKIYNSYRSFFKKAASWTQLGDEAFSLARSLTLSYLDTVKHNK